jgi:mRNA interferase MazF
MAKAPRRRQEKTVGRIRRGDVCLVSFDPTVGREIRKTRPALVIQNDIGNQYSPLTTVAAITSQVSAQPFPVEVVIEPSDATGLSKRSAIRLDQIRTIDSRRILKRLGRVDAVTMRAVEDAIRISLGLVAI